MLTDIHDDRLGRSDGIEGLLLRFFAWCCCGGCFFSNDGEVGCALALCCFHVAEVVECRGDLSWISVVVAIFGVDVRPVLLLFPAFRPCVGSLSNLDGI